MLNKFETPSAFPPESVTKTEQSYPKAKERLLRYLAVGERSSAHKEGNPFILSSKVRQYLLEAGFTELALACIHGQTYDFPVVQGSPTAYTSERSVIYFYIYAPNIYGIPPGKYDGVGLVRELVGETQIAADMTEGCDPLRAEVLRQVLEFKTMVVQAEQTAGKQRSIFEHAWLLSSDGILRFWLKPNDDLHKSGYYTLSEIKQWLSDDPESPTLVSRQKGKENAPSKIFKEFERASFLRLVQMGLTAQSEAERLDYARRLRIVLMRCAFPDLIEEFTAALLPEPGFLR